MYAGSGCLFLIVTEGSKSSIPCCSPEKFYAHTEIITCFRREK